MSDPGRVLDLGVSDPDLSAPLRRDAGWLAGAHSWIADRCAALGISVTGSIEQPHARPWSTVLRVPTHRMPLWFKANCPGAAYEAALLDGCSRWCPDGVLAPLAVDPKRGWLLLPDGGPTLREAAQGHTDLAHWERILVHYAELQRTLSDYDAELLALGVPDMRPSVLPSRYAGMLDEPGWLRLGLADGLAPGQVALLREHLPAYGRWCSRLDEIGVPASLQHDDLHDGNVFVPRDGVGHYQVFDWGDAAVAHPFSTLMVTLRVVSHLLGLPYGSDPLLRLRDAYLESWTADHDRRDLVEAARLAVRVGGVARAASYCRALAEATPAALSVFGNGVPAWLLAPWEPTPLEPDPPRPRASDF